MRCVICRTGETHPGVATVFLEHDRSIVIIKGVPADVCDNCDEYYLNEDMADWTLKRAEAAAANGTEVEIVQYAA